MADGSSRQPPQGDGVGRVLVGVELGPAAGRDHAAQELHDGVARGLGRGAPVAALEPTPPPSLARGHRPAAPQLRLVEAVDVVGGAHQQVQVEGPVLPALEAAEAVEHEGLQGRAAGTARLVEQQAVASQALGLALHGAGRERELAGDLAQGGAAEQAEEEGPQQARLAEPVGGGEGL